MFEYENLIFCTIWRMLLWMHEILIEYEFLIWMKMHVWMHEIWFFVLFEECIYECMKLCEFSELKCMLECINSFCLFDFVPFFWRMHLWMHKTWFFFVLLFLKNVYMNAWNLIFWFCYFYFEWGYMFECMKLYF